MCNMLQHLIVLHMIFACMESNDSPVCIQMLGGWHHLWWRSGHGNLCINGPETGEKGWRGYAVNSGIAWWWTFYWYPGKDTELKRIQSSWVRFGFVVFPKTFDCWTFESISANLFKWLLLKAFPAICLFMFLHFLQNVPSPRDQLGNWKRAQLVKMYSSGCQPLTTCNLPKMQPLPMALGDGPNFLRYRWDCDIFWSTRRVEMLGKPEAPWKHQRCTHHFSSKKIKKHRNQIWNGDY